jgi:HSP20 family protein
MSVRDLIPWGRSNNRAPAPYRDDDRSPFLSLRLSSDRRLECWHKGSSYGPLGIV